MTEHEERSLFVSIANIEADIRVLKNGRPECHVHAAAIAEHARRLGVIEQAAGKEKFVTALLGALGAALVLLGKYVVGKG